MEEIEEAAVTSTIPSTPVGGAIKEAALIGSPSPGATGVKLTPNRSSLLQEKEQELRGVGVKSAQDGMQWSNEASRGIWQ